MLATALVVFFTAQTPSPVVVTGCLTSTTVAGQPQFTLTTTDTNRAAADVKTEAYQLKAPTNIDLKSMVGHRVEVTGTEITATAANTTVDDSRVTQQPRGTSGKTPTVETKAKTDIVVHQMNVTAAKAVAGDCRVP